MAISNLTKNIISKKIKFICMAATLAISMGYTEIAQALKISTSGEWTFTKDTNNNINNFTGLNSNKISWGNPYNNSNPTKEKSSYVFEGIENQRYSRQSLISGDPFKLGEFTHNNFAITGSSLKEARLQLDLDFKRNNGNSIFSQTFNLGFQHNETPNNGENGVCTFTPGYDTPCPDIVSLPTLISTEGVEIGGSMYKLLIEGFKQNATDTEFDTQFITLESKSNTTNLYARLEKVSSNTPSQRVPEPTAGLGLFAIGAAGALKFKKKNKNLSGN